MAARFEAEKISKYQHQNNLSKSPSLAEVLDYWIKANAISLKKSTLAKYSFLMNKHIIPDLGHMLTEDIDTKMLNAYIKFKMDKGRLDEGGGLSAAYASTMLIIIRSAISFAAEEGLCARIRGNGKMPRRSAKEVCVLGREERAKLEAYLKNNSSPAAVGIALALYMGLRIGEVCALRWEDVDLEEALIHVRCTLSRIEKVNESGKKGSVWVLETPKTTSSRRKIPIPSILIPVLQDLKGRMLSEFVVSDKSGFISPRTFDYRFHRVLAQIDVEWVNFHVLRHSFATRCIEAGMDVKTLSELLGHSNVSITLNTYVHSSMERKRSQIEMVTIE